jgi:hypothetical protein
MSDAVSDSRFSVGETVQVYMPRGHNKRGVWGISVLYTTSPEAKFDGAVGTIVEIDPKGPYTIPLYLVDFRESSNKVAVPWQAQWFREEWLVPVKEKARAS